MTEQFTPDLETQVTDMEGTNNFEADAMDAAEQLEVSPENLVAFVEMLKELLEQVENISEEANVELQVVETAAEDIDETPVHNIGERMNLAA